MNRAILIMTGAAALISQAAMAEEQSFSLRLRDIPWNFEECHEQAKQFGERVKEYAGLNVTGTLCTRDSTLGDLALEVRYLAESPIQLVATNASLAVLGNDGFYKTEDECLEDLPSQVSLFESKTGRSALISYCSLPGSFAKAWDFVIASVGAADTLPRNGGFYLFGAPQGHSAESFTRALAGLIEQLGGQLAIAGFSNRLANTSASYRYYSTEHIHLVEEYASRTYDKDVCEAQRLRLESALAARPIAEPRLIYCSHTFGAGRSMELTMLLPRDHPFRFFDTSGSTEFESLEQCVAGRDAVLSRFRESFGRDVIEGFCNYDYQSRRYNVKMLDIR